MSPPKARYIPFVMRDYGTSREEKQELIGMMLPVPKEPKFKVISGVTPDGKAFTHRVYYDRNTTGIDLTLYDDRMVVNKTPKDMKRLRQYRHGAHYAQTKEVQTKPRPRRREPVAKKPSRLQAVTYKSASASASSASAEHQKTGGASKQNTKPAKTTVPKSRKPSKK